MQGLECKMCGGKLAHIDDVWVCDYCGATFEPERVDNAGEELRRVLDDIAEEKVANLRRRLWDKMNEKYTDSVEIVRVAKEIRATLPDDFFASFCEVTNSGNAAEVNAFIDNIDEREQREFLEVIIKFMLKSLKAEYLLSLNNLIERAYKGIDLNKYEIVTNALAEEAKKVDSGVYELNMPRDCFLAYSSKDMNVVSELVAALEDQGISCFVAMRNLQHGRGAVQNYQHALETAMDNCKVVVFVSGKNSRNLSCDAIRHELPYIKRRDCERVPAQYGNMPYDKIPSMYKKPRVEYRISVGEGNTAADKIVKDFFAGQEYCYSIDDVIQRVAEYLVGTSSVLNVRDIAAQPTRKRSSPPDEHEGQGRINNYIRRIELFLKDRDFESAREYCEKVLDIDMESCDAYIYELCCDIKLSSKNELEDCCKKLNEFPNFQKALQFADEKQKKFLLQCYINAKKKYDIERCNETNKKQVRDLNAALEIDTSAAQKERDNNIRQLDITIDRLKENISEINRSIATNQYKINENKETLTNKKRYIFNCKKKIVLLSILLVFTFALLGTGVTFSVNYALETNGGFISDILSSGPRTVGDWTVIVTLGLLLIGLIILISSIVKIRKACIEIKSSSAIVVKLTKEISSLQKKINSSEEEKSVAQKEYEERRITRTIDQSQIENNYNEKIAELQSKFEFDVKEAEEQLVEQIKQIELWAANELTNIGNDTFVPAVNGSVDSKLETENKTVETVTNDFSNVKKESFDIILKQVGDNKFAVIDVIRKFTGLPLNYAQGLVELAPSIVKEKVDKSVATEFAEKLRKAGATVEVK